MENVGNNRPPLGAIPKYAWDENENKLYTKL